MECFSLSYPPTYDTDMVISLTDEEYEALDESLALAQRLLINHPGDALHTEAQMAPVFKKLREELLNAWNMARLVRAQ